MQIPLRSPPSTLLRALALAAFPLGFFAWVFTLQWFVATPPSEIPADLDAETRARVVQEHDRDVQAAESVKWFDRAGPVVLAGCAYVLWRRFGRRRVDGSLTVDDSGWTLRYPGRSVHVRWQDVRSAEFGPFDDEVGGDTPTLALRNAILRTIPNRFQLVVDTRTAGVRLVVPHDEFADAKSARVELQAAIDRRLMG